MVSINTNRRDCIAFEGHDYNENKAHNKTLELTKELLGRRRKRRGIELDDVLDTESYCHSDSSHNTFKVQNNLHFATAQQKKSFEPYTCFHNEQPFIY